MTSKTIISLGILKVNWEKYKKDYIENFVPLVAECIRLCSDDVISLQALQTQMKDQFGLNLPQHVLEKILKRVSRSKYIYHEKNVYHPNRKQLSKLHYKQDRDEILRCHEEVIMHLIKFALEKYSLKWSEEDAENALLSFLDENELSVVNTTMEGSTIPEIKNPIISSKYVIGSFVYFLQTSQSSLLNYFDTIVKGYMLSNAIFLPDVYEPQKNFKGTEIYFDTPFLINALGYAGSTRQAPCLELLRLLYTTGANLRCFEHTKEEIIGALDAISGQLSRGRRNFTYGPGIPTFEYFLSKGFTSSDLDILIGRVERDLIEVLNIKVVERPEYLPEFTIDETGLLKFITERVKYWRDKAAEKDVDSISAIFRIRRNREYHFIEDCKAIFITNNKKLVKAINEYFYLSANSLSVSPCLTDYSITNLLWLKRPTAAPDLPIKRIIADCFAATQPNEELWGNYLKEINQLEKDKRITTDDYYYLRYSIEAKKVLMDLTLGEPEVFTQGTVNEILDLIKDQIRADLADKLKKSEERVRIYERDNDVKIQKIKAKSSYRAKLIIKLLRYVFLFFLTSITIITAPWLNIITSLPILFWIVWVILALFSVVTMHFGTSTEVLLKKLEIRLEKRIEGRLLKTAYINTNIDNSKPINK